MPQSRWELHVERWIECKACALHETRRNVVLGKGQVPCDIVLLGEAPGKGEDTLANPFEGPAGHLLDHITNAAIGLWHRKLRLAYTNLISCIPLSENKAGELVKTTEPPDWAVEACTPRLQEFMRVADPNLIICVGKKARDWLDPGYRDSIQFHKQIPLEDIPHPAWILQRLTPAHQPGKINQCIVRIKKALEKYFP